MEGANKMDLTTRQNRILKLVLDLYIQTAEPVGSKAISESVNGEISSATIRNEMSHLEELGLLEKPHVSAGRIPTDKAYREYVDNLMTVSNLNDIQIKQLNQEFLTCLEENGDVLESASNLLSQRTGYASVSLSPKAQASFVKELKILMIEPGSALVIAIISPGIVHDRLIRINEIFSNEDLQIISHELEKMTRGVHIDDITLVALQEVSTNLNVDPATINQLLYEVYITIKQADELELKIDGIGNLTRQPEFNSVDQLSNLYTALTKNRMLAAYISDETDKNQESLMIRIGQEIQIANLDTVSLISTSYKFNDKLTGTIGIVGPKRMDYESLLPKISFMRYKLNDLYDKGLVN